jgi:hypothetical protein
VKTAVAWGRRWKVRRRWLPWRRRVRDVPDVPIDDIGLGDDPISAIIGIFLLVLAIPALVVMTLLLAELLLLLVLLPVFVVVRLLLPVPWTIEVWVRPAERRFLGWHLEHEVPVEGWRASQERIAEIAEGLQSQKRGDRYVPRGARAKTLDGRAGDDAGAGPTQGAGGPTTDPPGGIVRSPGGSFTPPAAGAGAGGTAGRAGEAAPDSTASPAERRASDAPPGGTTPTPNPFAQRDE